MSVLKWRLGQLNSKTRDRDRAAKADREDIELITDEANNVATAATAASAGVSGHSTERHSRREGATAAASVGRQDKRRLGMREKLGLSQVQRGREIRRVELRRKKNRRHSDDDKDEQHQAAVSASDDTAATVDESTTADRRLAHEEHQVGVRKEEEKQQLDADSHGTGTAAGGGMGGAGGGDFISALHHTHDSKAEAHDEGEEDRRRRRDRQQQHEGQPLRAALELHGSSAVERAGKRVGHLSSTRPLTLSQQLHRLHRSGDGSSNTRHGGHSEPAATNTTTSRPHTPPAPSPSLAPTLDTAAPAAAQSLDGLSYSLASPPPLSLPFLPAVIHSLAFCRSSSLKRRWFHFHSLAVSPPCVSLVRASYFLCAVDNFQNDGRAMRNTILLDINRHFSRLVQLLDIALTLPHDAYSDDEHALYAHLLTVLPEDVIVSSATPTARRPASEAVKARLLTVLPLLLSSAVFSLLYSLFPLSRHLLTLSFLHRLDCSLIALTCGFDMADSTVARQRAAYFNEQAIESFSVTSLAPTHFTGVRRTDRSVKSQSASVSQSAVAVTDSSGNMFSRGDWALDEKERREQRERRKVLTSTHCSSVSALSPDFIRSDPTLSPYQRVLLLDLLTPPSGSRQQLLNANSLSPLLAVGLQRRTPDSSWRLEHKLRYVVPAQPHSSHSQRPSGDPMGGADNGAARSVAIEQEAERWVRKMRGEGSRRSRQRGRGSVERDEAATAASRASNCNAAAQVSPAPSSSSFAQRDKVVEGDPLAVLTPRTRKLVLRYSTAEDEDEYVTQQQQQQQQHSKDGKVVRGAAGSALVANNSTGTTDTHPAEPSE